jgi:cation:H+ antiporter
MIIGAIFFICLGALFLYFGAEFLVESASQIAHKLSISPLVIGIVIVGYGTSLPELLVSIRAAFTGAAELSVGNVIGSNICNIGLILGGTLLFFGNIPLTQMQRNKDLPLLLFLTVLGVIFLWDQKLFFSEGIFFLAVACAYSVYMFFSDIHVEEGVEVFRFSLPLWGLALVTLGSFLMLALGADFFVKGSVKLAMLMGISEAVIGLTIVAIGTSLPEIATSIVATCRKKPGLVLGNIIGSNVFNLFFILGVVGVLHPVEIKEVGQIDFTVMCAFSLLLYLFALFSKKNLTRFQGGGLFGCYLAYLFFLLSRL